MIKARDGRILFLIKALVAMIFIAKISLGSFLPVPRNFSFILFQAGLHPVVNVFLCVLFGVPLLLLFLKVRDRYSLSPFYKLFLFLLTLTLSVQTVLQTHFVNTQESTILQLGAAGMAIFMIMVYGVAIPSLWSPEDFVRFVQRWSGTLVLISLALLLVAPGAVFKGGRFIGIFKHIPHMVTCATIAFVFSLGTFLVETKSKHKIWNALIIFTSFVAVVLTGTRSSAAAALLAFVVTMIMHKTQSNQGRIFKFAFISLFVTFTLFFGPTVYEFAQGIATGQNSLGNREAQDGVASRWEEVERGSEIFMEEPWLGHGLLSKFAAGNDVDVSNYNAMKDPHNIFISAGVIGGWPFLALSGFALLIMTIGALKTLMVSDISKRQIAIYLLAHIPILVIYHVHLSIGGMADRMYWMVFGFVAASTLRSIQNQTLTKN
ncbi:hypothetical protein AZI86_03335 [Bdellovibrio bacteriovorus]|uniref:O-antigen ligase-related domain-containing protein n=1 Tax=Bdellovibrio bacteriovorus TaxID=959 RepID=A0A150WNW2_BDEBC|nr:O-antigen ligase family protein [Bdellovibrio bacteriovorus]KYG66110.1 hypothetical protein AZI86_03335 [Bdellovibrio bacteriovorus]